MNETLPGTPSPDAGPDPLRDLLARVASGDLDPAEAARLLDEDPTAPTIDRTVAPAAAPTDGPVMALALRAGGVKLTVVADPTVDTLVADGPHSLHREGSTLVLDAPISDGYQTQPAPRFLGWVPTTWTAGRGEKVTVRVNPALPLSIEAIACSVDVVGLAADLTLGGSASAVKVRDHRGPVHGSLSMGSVTLVGAITGPSSLTCELGSVNVRLAPGSDVTVTAVAEMGSIKAAGPGSVADSTGGDGSMRRVIVAGPGSQPFDITVRMGSGTVVTS